MKRAPLLRKSPLRAKSSLVTRTKLARSAPMRRTRLAQKAPKSRSPERGGDPAYLAFVRTRPCCACGARPPSHAHHETLGGRGKSQKAPDRRTLPFCFECHDDFHAVRGRFKGATREQRRVFQQDEIARLNAIHDGIVELGVEQEPLRRAV